MCANAARALRSRKEVMKNNSRSVVRLAPAPQGGSKREPELGELFKQLGEVMANVYAHSKCPMSIAHEIVEFESAIFNQIEAISESASRRRSDLQTRLVLPMLCQIISEEEPEDSQEEPEDSKPQKKIV
jgi:ribosomal protein L25 (general stress protein Ctc)